MTAIVPNNMSLIDAFQTLLEKAQNEDLRKDLPTGETTPYFAWNAVQAYVFYCRNHLCETVDGTTLNVDFSRFPYLNVEKFDRKHGIGTAQTAIDEYSKSIEKFSEKKKFSLDYDIPCKYFTEYWKQQTHTSLRKSLAPQFHDCEIAEKEAMIQEKSLTKKKSSTLLIIYKIQNGPERKKETQDKTTLFFQQLVDEGKGNILVKDFTHCGSGPFPYLRHCETKEALFLKTALDILKKQEINPIKNP